MGVSIGRLFGCRPASSRLPVHSIVLLFLGTVLLSPCTAQQSPRRDPSAIAFLSQAVSAAGGTTNLSAIQDYAASGTITHYWDSKAEEGQVTVKARGLTQFRLDSKISEGTWSFIVNNGSGRLVVPSGKVTQIAGHNSLNVGSLTWPILAVNLALLDETTTVIDKGLVQLGNERVREIHVQKNFKTDPNGILSKLTQKNYWFDASTLVLVRVEDQRHPDNDALHGALTHTLDFRDFHTVDGALVPFSVVEKVADQETWKIQLATMSLNAGLSDSDFQF
jgi:outer membrane lipoprotein-sorting protein